MDLLAAQPELVEGSDGVRIATTVIGDGPPLLLLHGYPEMRAMWREVAPALAERFTVVATDLRGYGESDVPRGEVYSKRAMAADQLEVMTRLGFDSFFVAGHDRGARVGHRMALDAPDRVRSLGVIDIVPTLHMFDHVDRAMATSYFHWFFLGLGAGLPEDLIRAAPERWLRSRFEGRWSVRDPLPPEVFDRYLACFLRDGVIEATCADYRAAASTDLEHDRSDASAGRALSVPVLALWGADGYVGRNFDVLGVWRAFAPDVEGHAIQADHYLPEEAPEATAKALGHFFERCAATGMVDAR
ncbi:alpha/beta hydrolase [Microbacterium sp. CFBP9034]|uniref:alpha/beta fold hydrolase n=1 Tax=Microbacterium sp. CFBP9034 TaxID=3096540 RepID=UPI002A6B25D2|nr:alpha/beta hydrolase [Microbacterium sp. CFBP9034]MDY0908524.1 alpha/beta hydrolase [Microbacterium sp. CFBP9034]